MFEYLSKINGTCCLYNQGFSMTGERKLLQTPRFLLLTILLLIGARLGGKEVEVEPVIIPIFDFVSFVMKGITDLQYVTKIHLKT
mgnify:CR=1 FL=1